MVPSKNSASVRMVFLGFAFSRYVFIPRPCCSYVFSPWTVLPGQAPDSHLSFSQHWICLHSASRNFEISQLVKLYSPSTSLPAVSQMAPAHLLVQQFTSWGIRFMCLGCLLQDQLYTEIYVLGGLLLWAPRPGTLCLPLQGRRLTRLMF